MEDKVLEIKDKMSDIVMASDVTDIRLTQAGYYWGAGYNEFDFSCKINGKMDILHMVQQRHGDGYGLVIRAEKNDIWDRITGSEAFRLEEKLLDEVQYRTYHNRIEKLASLSDCQEMHFELMENDNPNLNHVIGKFWTELNQKENMLSAKVIEDFREQTEEHFHPVGGMNAGEIEEMVSYYVQAKIIENKLDVKVENVILSGSRCRGIEKIGSDLDVVVDYKGTIREDDFFNILHEDGFVYLNCVMDLYARKIIAWTLADTMEVSTVIETINKAKACRNTDQPLIIHSDRGSQYVSAAWREATETMQRSYSHSGYPYDNACIESFHSLIKREWLNRFNIINFKHAYRLVFEFIETFYNTVRIHSHCDYMSPSNFEKLYERVCSLPAA